MTNGWISRQRHYCWAVVVWMGLNLFPFLSIHPRQFFFFFLVFFALCWFYAAGLHSYLKHFINPCKGNFLHKEFRVFHVFCIYLTVINWKSKTPPYAFFPHFAYWLKELVQTPDMGSLGGIVGIRGRAAGVHTDVLRLLCRQGLLEEAEQ